MLSEVNGFFSVFLRRPKSVGAVAPATESLATAIAIATRRTYRRHRREQPFGLIELGAGTGALTQKIQGFKPVLIEREAVWAEMLSKRFPSLDVRRECAVDALSRIAEPVGLVNSIPMFNNPQAGRFRQLLGEKYEAGLVKFCVLYTYAWTNPMRGVAFREVRRFCFVTRSLPPAYVWVCE